MKTIYEIAQPYIPRILGALALRDSKQFGNAVSDLCRDIMVAKNLSPISMVSDEEILMRIRNADPKGQAVLTALFHLTGV